MKKEIKQQKRGSAPYALGLILFMGLVIIYCLTLGNKPKERAVEPTVTHVEVILTNTVTRTETNYNVVTESVPQVAAVPSTNHGLKVVRQGFAWASQKQASEVAGQTNQQ